MKLKERQKKTETVNIRISTGGGTGEGTTGGLTVEKYEADSERALEDVAFSLVKTIGNKEIVVREGKTDADGKLAWKGLKFGDYTLKEVIPDGYLGEESQTVTISSNESENITTLSVENERRTGIAKIIKRDLGTSAKLSGATFKLTNVETKQDYTLATESDGTIDQELPFGEYMIVEIKTPDGYRKMNPIDNVIIKVDEETEITIDNMKLIEIEGKKTWNDISSPIRPDNIKVNLTRKMNGELDDSFETRTLTVSPDNDGNWDYKFNEEFDKYNNEGIEFEYLLEEDQVPSGYRSSFEIDEDGNYNIINTRTGTTSVAGEKIWEDDDPVNRPESIKVNLLKGNTVIRTQEVTADEEGNWNYSFTGLSRYDSNGRYISYSVKEQAVPGYKTEIKGTTITNTRSEKTAIEITKGWLDEDASKRPDSIDVRIYQNDDFFKEVTLTADDNWVYELQDIDAYDEDGKAYVYTLEEEEVSGYETIIDGFNITNRRVGEVEIKVNKIWENDTEEDRPFSILVDLIQNGEVIETVELTSENGWTHQFKNLAEFDQEGLPYIYSVTEEKTDGYISSVQTTEDGFEIVNTYDESSLPEEPEDPEEPEEPEDDKPDKEKDDEVDESTKASGPSDSKDPVEEKKLPQTGEADSSILYFIGMAFIFVGFGIGKKKFKH